MHFSWKVSIKNLKKCPKTWHRSNKLVRDFERENHILIDAEKQLKRKDTEKDVELER